ncbi:MAG: class B sortase [Lachnospiraceae bacterium]|nr:class B sortase [Lachnospiraceae bacterium]
MSRRRNGEGMSTGMLIVLVVVATLLCVTLAVLMYMDKKGMLDGGGAGTVLTDGSGENAGAAEDSDNADNIHPETDMTDAPAGPGTDSDLNALIPQDKDVDITSLKSRNPDIYAWLYIPEAGIDEPILQNSEDVNYYITHNADGEPDENGSVFTQMLNSKDFSDNLTVIYGHNSGDDKGFSNLKVFGDPDYFAKYPYIYIYTEDRILVYKTFAAYESDDKLIILFYGTQDDELYHIYLSNIEEYAGIGGRLDKDEWPLPSDRIITLSTGVTEREDRRFLVQAKLIMEKTR